jgi:hypothetical protein|tara:strand:+ start:153 stop:584 length:432 start_codon:yes stop_codon:yes gene_type:complete
MIDDGYPHIMVRDTEMSWRLKNILTMVSWWNQDNSEPVNEDTDDFGLGLAAVIEAENVRKILHLSKCPTEKDKYILQYYLKEDWADGPWDFEESALKAFKKVFGENFNEEEHDIVYETFPMTERELYFFMEGLSCAFGKKEEE